MPRIVRALWASTGRPTTICPRADAWLLMRYIRTPVRESSWKASDRRWECRYMSLRRSSTIFWSTVVVRYSLSTMRPPPSALSSSVAATASAISPPVPSPNVLVTHCGASFSPRTVSMTNASGHGSASASAESATVSTIEMTACLRYGRRYGQTFGSSRQSRRRAPPLGSSLPRISSVRRGLSSAVFPLIRRRAWPATAEAVALRCPCHEPR
jgi:hypothetical protein